MAETLKFSLGFASLMLIAMMVIFARSSDWLAKISVALLVTMVVSGSLTVERFLERSFFGVSRVTDSADGEFRILIHGSTNHGGERIRDKAGQRTAKPVPELYYHPEASIARGFELSRSLMSEGRGAATVGVIGLGAGTLACYLKDGEKITFHEIDPVMVRIARDSGQFRFLSECAPDAGIVLGDARLTVARDGHAKYDYLVVDAFSSGSVPAHLLTREAIELYLSRVTETGLVAMHISNRYLELESVIASTAGTLDGIHAAIVIDPGEYQILDGIANDVVFLSRSRSAIDEVLSWPGARVAQAGRTLPWSDNYADIPSALWRRFFSPGWPAD